MKILILTLSGQRDKVVDDSIAVHLRGYGHEVFVHDFARAGFQSVPFVKPDVVVAPMPGGEFKYEFVKQCKKWGCEVIVRRGEAGVSKKEFGLLDIERQNIILGHWEYGPYVDLELVWGQEFADIVASQEHMENTEIRTCGAFAFDTYFGKQPPQEPRDKTILFASGFSCADYSPDQAECGLPEGSEYHKVIYDLHREARDIWIDAICEMVQRWKDDWRFELKVRPGELTKEYIDRLPVEVKIHKTSAPSYEVLRGIDVLVHSGSTMAIEAHLMDISAFNFCNVNPDLLLSKVSPVAADYNHLEFMVSQVIPGMTNINHEVYEQLKLHLYGKIDGKACENAAKHIHDHIAELDIKTDIPWAWPKEPRFLTAGVHVEQELDDAEWMCPICKNKYYAKIGMDHAKCPYCAVNIKKDLTLSEV